MITKYKVGKLYKVVKENELLPIGTIVRADSADWLSLVYLPPITQCLNHFKYLKVEHHYLSTPAIQYGRYIRALTKMEEFLMNL